MVVRTTSTVGLVSQGNQLFSATFAVPGVSPDPSLVFDGYRSVYRIEWSGVRRRVQVTGGKVQVKHDSLLQFSVDVEEGPFPPTRNGSLTSSALACSGFLSGLVVSVELHEGSAASTQLVETEQRLSAVSKRMKELRTSFAVSTASTSLVLIRLSFSTTVNDACSIGNTAMRGSGNDVCFLFPRTGQTLWASETLLVAASPYFKALFASSFAESTASTSSLPRKVGTPDYVFEESDEETDQAEAAKETSSTRVCSCTPHKTITITDTAYTTYFSLLVFLHSRHLSFAPLLSRFRNRANSRQDALIFHANAVSGLWESLDPLLPPPTSPKSIYRLAHLLELDDVASLAMDNFRSQLTPDNAAYELYSDAASCYVDVRDVVLEYVVANWEEVTAAEGTREMRERGVAGQLDAVAVGTAMLLAERLFERKKKV